MSWPKYDSVNCLPCIQKNEKEDLNVKRLWGTRHKVCSRTWKLLRRRKGGKCAYTEREREGGWVMVGRACRRRWALKMADAGGLYRQWGLFVREKEMRFLLWLKGKFLWQCGEPCAQRNCWERRGLSESRISKKSSSISSPSTANSLLFPAAAFYLR